MNCWGRINPLIRIFIVCFCISGVTYAADKRADYGELVKTLSNSSDSQMRVIVELTSDYPVNADSRAADNIHSLQQNTLNNLTLGSFSNVKNFTYMPMIAMKVTAQALDSLYKNKNVKRIYEDRLDKSSQIENVDRPQLWDSTEEIQAIEMWERGLTGAGQAIAIIDNGVRISHEMFTGRVLTEACFSSNDSSLNALSACPAGVTRKVGPGAARPLYGFPGFDHGTHVAAIALGDSPIDFNFANDPDGVANGAQLIAINVFSRFFDAAICSGSPPCLRSFISDQMRALDFVYGLRNKYEIASVNMSLGGGNYGGFCDSTDARTAIVNKLYNAGVRVVASSGNDGSQNSSTAPACISNVIAVGSTTFLFTSRRISSFSNSSQALDLLAPGYSIYSAGADANDDYTVKSGTSMAAPHVAGAIAVLRSARKKTKLGEIEAALKSYGISMLDNRNGVSRSFVQLLNSYKIIPSRLNMTPMFNLLLMSEL